jgi:hypothetical protein
MFGKILNNEIQYPVDPYFEHEGQVPLDFRNGKIGDDEYVFVETTNPPEMNSHQKPVESQPILKNGKWLQTWNVVDLTDDELKQKKDFELYNLRKKRNAILQSTDWMFGTDSCISEADKARFKEYRQQLRELPNKKDFDVLNYKFPTRPAIAKNEQPEVQGAMVL